MAAPGPGLVYRAAQNISYRAGLRAAEVCNLKLGDIDSAPLSLHWLRSALPGNGTLIHVEQGNGRKIM
ncbi:MAG: hypothetical protein AB8B85_10035 [Paracoccaceae bacterium]